MDNSTNITIDESAIISDYADFEQQSYSKYKDLFNEVKKSREFLSGNQYDDLDNSLIGQVAATDRINLNVTKNIVRTIVNSYSQAEYKWLYSDDLLNQAAKKFLDDIDNTTAAIEALTNSVGTGLGVLVLSNEYDIAGNIKPILYSLPDVTTVRLDPYASKLNHSDATRAAIIEIKSKKQIKKLYPDILIADRPSVTASMHYDTREEMPLVTYYVKEESGIMCYKLANNQVLEAISLPYTYIPIVPVFGESSYVDDKLTYIGIASQLHDIQRLINYSYRQLLIRASKSPKNTFICDAEAIEGNEQYYKNADKSLNPLLIYNGYSADGQRQLAAPTRLNNDIQYADVQAVLNSCLSLVSNLIGIPSIGLETDTTKTATQVLTETKMFNNNIRAYIQHLKYAYQVLGLIFAEEVTNTNLYGQITVNIVEGPDAALTKQVARTQLSQYSSLITDENAKANLVKSLLEIDADNMYISKFISTMNPQVDQQAQQLLAQANDTINELNSQISQLQMQLDEQAKKAEIDAQLQAYSMQNQMLLNKQKYEHEYNMKLLDAQLEDSNISKKVNLETAAAISQVSAKAQAELQVEAAKLQAKQLEGLGYVPGNT